MKIALFNGKGGIGRTTLSLNLAGYYASRGLKVLVVDRDPQGSASGWAALAGETPFVVSKSRVKGFDVEIYDCPPKLAETELIDADAYLVPTILEGASLTVYLRTMQLLKKANLKVPIITVVNKFNLLRSEHKERLKGFPDALVVRDRAAFASYYGYGKTVFELAERGRATAAAKADIKAIADRLDDEAIEQNLERRNPFRLDDEVMA
ncbi:hypothetical protein B9Y60_10545 [Stenotrophomonas maltophilia]|nr:hypothetical protein B9Y73_10545 [Stenotrophomonas maltophilia]PJL55251.1 hypothetical protein B9Y60_10545 [Stenotrophomonas maltophilia]